ncbi:unnamed protein product [Ectocarpus sp. 8 AP-2014]
MAERRSATPTADRDMDPAIITSNSATNVSSLTTLRLGEYSAPTATGRCLLAQFTDREVIVYQAYKPELGNFAVENQYFGGDGFNFKRTSWIKPNFTWMMYRCGWASKQNQEVVLALALRRDFWDNVLSQAVMSNYESYRSTMSAEVPRGDAQRRWKASLKASDVVMQWDPDHMPFTGHKTNHRAIQLGLRGDALAAFRGPAFGETGIQDVSAFAKATEEIHRPRAADGGGGGGHPAAPAATSPPALLLPIEETYPVMDASVAQRLGID